MYTFVLITADVDLPLSLKQLFRAVSITTSVVSSKSLMTNLTGDDIAGIHALVAQGQVGITLQEKVIMILYLIMN